MKVWDAETGRKCSRSRGIPAWFASVAFSPDGKRIAQRQLGQDGEGVGRDTGQEMLTLKGHTHGVERGLQPGRQADRSAAASDKTLEGMGRGDGPGNAHAQGAHGLGVQRGLQPGRQADRSAAAWDKTVKVWDAATGQEMLTLKGHTGVV